MKILIKQLFDKSGHKEYIFYEVGNFIKPLFILSEGFAEDLKNQLNNMINDDEYQIRKIKRK